MVTIFVLIDALGWQYLEGREFLNDVLAYRAPLQTVLGFSSGAIPTILTGAPPAVTGHWNLFYYDPAGSPFLWLRLVHPAIARMIGKCLCIKYLATAYNLLQPQGHESCGGEGGWTN